MFFTKFNIPGILYLNFFPLRVSEAVEEAIILKLHLYSVPGMIGPHL